MLHNTPEELFSRNKVWDPLTLSWVAMTQPIIATDTLNVTVTNDDPLEQYKIANLDSNGYYGFLKIGGAWYIMYLTGTSATYIKGNSNYADNWTGRMGLTYGQFDAVFI